MSSPSFTRENVAAFLLDRADQFDNDDPQWVSLCDIATAILMGAVEDAVAHGELPDAGLTARLDTMKRAAQASGEYSGTPVPARGRPR